MSNRDALFYALKEINGSLITLNLMISELVHQTGKTNEINEVLDALTGVVEEMKEEDSLNSDTPDDGKANYYVGIDKTVNQLRNSINKKSKKIASTQANAPS